MKKTSEGKSKYGGIFTAYVMRTIPPRQKRCRELEIYSDTDGEYEDEYKCCPPPLGMICISLLMVCINLISIFHPLIYIYIRNSMKATF